MCYRRRLKHRFVVLPTEMIPLYSVSLSLFLTISPILFTLPSLYLKWKDIDTELGKGKEKEKEINTKQDV